MAAGVKRGKGDIEDMRKKSGVTPDGNEFVRITKAKAEASESSGSLFKYSGLDMIPLGGYAPDHRALLKYEHGDTYRWSDAYYEMMSENDVLPITSLMQTAYRPPESKLVHGGRWVILIRSLPLSPNARPERWGIYWAIPCRDSKNYDGYDEGGMYKVNILVPTYAEVSGGRVRTGTEYVGAFPHEYTVLDDRTFREETENEAHYSLQQLNIPSEGGMNLELIERGRALTEEERESVWALMLDGLSELHACQEYFLSRHVAEDNASIWYKPTPELVEVYDDMFGGMIENIGRPLKPRKGRVD